MYIYKIDPNMNKNISNDISKIVNKYNKNDKIEAIFMNTFYKKINQEKDNPIIIEIILVGESDIKFYENIKIRMGDTMILPKVYSEKSDIYSSEIDLENQDRMIAMTDLYNGEILFDRNGRFTKLKKEIAINFKINKMDRKRIFSNGVEFDPPLQLTKK